MWCDVMWCDVMWCDVMWCDVMWCDVMWCDVMWCDVMWCDVRCEATKTEIIWSHNFSPFTYLSLPSFTSLTAPLVPLTRLILLIRRQQVFFYLVTYVQMNPQRLVVPPSLPQIHLNKKQRGWGITPLFSIVYIAPAMIPPLYIYIYIYIYIYLTLSVLTLHLDLALKFPMRWRITSSRTLEIMTFLLLMRNTSRKTRADTERCLTIVFYNVDFLTGTSHPILMLNSHLYQKSETVP